MWIAMYPRPITRAPRHTPPLTMAWDFFIFFSRRDAAGGRPGMVVATSDMEKLQFALGICPVKLGVAVTGLIHGYTNKMKGG